jgi:protein phosphatase
MEVLNQKLVMSSVACRIEHGVCSHKKDCFLLCTDGLYNAISDRCILDLLSRQYTASETAAELVMHALQNGSRDNITAIVIKPKRYDRVYPTNSKLG